MSHSPDEVFSQALHCYQQGQFQQSAQLLNALLQAKVASPDILNLMASSLFRLGDTSNAEKLFKASLGMNPDYPQTHVHVAGFFRESSRLEQSADHYTKSFELDSSNVESLLNAALIYQQLENWTKSESLIDLFLQRGGDKFEGKIRKAVCRYSLFDYASAELLLEQAESINPEQVITKYYFAQLFDKTKRKPQARELFEGLISEGHEPSKFSLSLLCFSEGSWKEAFSLYDNRPVARILGEFCRNNGANFWDGNSGLSGKHVLVYAEQGIGDQIRYMYFIDLLMKDAGKVSIIYDARLYPILTQRYPQINCISSEALSEEILHQAQPDVCLCVGSLGRVYGDALPLRANSNGLERDAAAFIRYDSETTWLPVKNKKRPLIGVSWRSIKYMAERSDWYCSAEDYGRLLEGIDADFVSLQYNLNDDERAAFSERGIKLIELDGLDLKDNQAELAAVVGSLDHVVSVSTALSELAGATGVASTVFAVADIRWFMSELHIRGFYPNTKVFYKVMFESWDATLEQARDSLLQVYGAQEGGAQ